MKHGKKPTVEQRKLITKHGLDWREWLVYKDLLGELHIVHRYSDSTKKVLAKEVRDDG